MRILAALNPKKCVFHHLSFTLLFARCYCFISTIIYPCIHSYICTYVPYMNIWTWTWLKMKLRRVALRWQWLAAAGCLWSSQQTCWWWLSAEWYANRQVIELWPSFVALILWCCRRWCAGPLAVNICVNHFNYLCLHYLYHTHTYLLVEA